MAHFLSTENANYINKHIELFTKNRVGEYSKYLNNNPIFVTYYSLSDVNTRVDSGIGGIQNELGPHSPLRFNMIENFPVYGIPELKPQLEVEDTGVDINLELSDIVILPNTIKPKVCDFFIVDIPNVKQLLFRVNNFNYNTIQSNDFYTLDCDIKNMGDDMYSLLETQIIYKYRCIFENIGTDNKCFILLDDIERIKAIEKFILEIRDIYTSMYYNAELNLFTMRKHSDAFHSECCLYDIYLTRFINESKIFQDDFDNNSIVLTYDDNVPSNFEYMWRKTLWYALIRNDTSFLDPGLYNVPNCVTKRFSPLIVYGYLTESVILFDHECPLPLGCNFMKEYPVSHYFSNNLLTKILNNEKEDISSLLLTEQIIFKFLRKERIDFNRNQIELEKEILNYSEENFKYIPIIIYILLHIHSEYFKKEDIKNIRKDDKNVKK